MEAWLALRGMRTLHLRLERACANAADLAERLLDPPGRRAGPLPRVRGDRQHRGGAAGRQGAERVAAATRLWVHATSLGGVESLLERRRRQPNEPEKVPEELVRLSVGVEDVEDLWRDLSTALDRSRRRA